MAPGSRRTVFFDRTTFSWTAVLAGVVAALVTQVLLTMFGLGIGLISIDATAANMPLGVSWGAFIYWAVAGIIAAFVAGWVTGAVTMPGTGAAHGLAAWAVATLIVVGAATLAAGNSASIAGNLLGPTAISMARYDDLRRDRMELATTGQRARAEQAEVESARRAVAAGMLASFVALVLGAFAAFVGGVLGSRYEAVLDR